MTNPSQKLLFNNVKQDTEAGLTQVQIASKYGVTHTAVSKFCTRHSIKLHWENSNSLGLKGELLFSKLFDYGINYNLTNTHSEFDFHSDQLGNIDVKYSTLWSRSQKSSTYKSGFRIQNLFKWSKHNQHKRATSKNTADTYVCFGVSDITNVCLIVPGFELEHRDRIQLYVSPTLGLDNSKSYWLQYIDLDISSRIQQLKSTIIKIMTNTVHGADE